uniref:Apolipoprotein B n=1 Tax=Romanomermis culicivorax TaxID=13658 RepID=A0A915HGC2_ROMCU
VKTEVKLPEKNQKKNYPKNLKKAFFTQNVVILDNNQTYYFIAWSPAVPYLLNVVNPHHFPKALDSILNSDSDHTPILKNYFQMAAAVTDTIDQILDIGDARSIDTILTNRFNGIFENSYDLAPVNFKPNAFVYMVYSALLTLPSTKKMITKNIEGILVNKGRNNLKVIISYGTEDDTFKLKCINFDAQIVPKFEPWSSMVVKEAYMKMKMWKKFHTQPDKFKDAFTEMHHVTFNYVTIDETTRITVSITKSKINVDSDFITNPGSGNNFVQITPIIGVPSWRANIQQLESSSLNDVKTSSYALVKALITQYHTLFLRAKLSPIEKNFGFFVIGSLELNWAQSSHLRIKPLTNFPAHGFSEIMIKHDPPLKPWISTSIPIVVKFIHNTATDDLSAKSKISSLATSIVKDEKFIVVGIDFDRLIASLPKYTGQLWNDLPTYTTVQEVENRPIKNFVHELLSMNFQYDAHRMMPALDRFIREQNQNEERGFQSYFLGELMSYDEQKLVKYVYHHGLLRETATTFTFKVEGSDRGILIDILKWPDNKRMDENTKRFVNEYINKIAPVDKLNMKKVTRLVLGPIQKGITYMGELDTVDYADVQKQLTGFWENVATVNPDALLKYFEDSEEGFQRIDNKNELHTMLSILKTNLFQYKGVMSSADIGHFLNGIFSERKKIVYEDFFGVMKDDNSPIFFSIVDAPNQDHHVKLNNKMNEIEEKYLLEYTYNEFRRKTDFISIAHDNDDAEFSLSKLTSYGSRKSIFESCISRVKRNALVKCGGYEQINEASYREDSGIKAKIKFHLDVVGKVSKFLMQGQIFKDMISALIRGDYKSFALNTAFLTMGPLMESLSIRIAAKGVSFGASLLGVSMIFAAPFMARLPMIGFIGYDLIQQVRDYKNGNSDALVNIAGDSSILAIEFTTATVEGAEGLGLVAGVADFLGPVGLAIGTAIFIGVDIYSSSNGEFVADNYIDLTTNVSKNVMKSDSNANLVCSDSSKLKTAVQMHVLNCRRAFGYESSLSAGGSAVIMLANGTDTAVTFKDEPTLFLIGDGVKFVTGSLASDTFILKGEVTVGYLNGHSGRNILNIAEYAKKRDHIVVDMLHGHVEFDHTYLEIQEIHNLIGRPFLQEFVQCHCETKFLDTQGGVNNTHPDDITIVLIKNCTYEMSIKLDGHVTVHNNALNGEFKYFTSRYPHLLYIVPEIGAVILNQCLQLQYSIMLTKNTAT